MATKQTKQKQTKQEQTKQEQTKSENTLYSVYGARLSKSAKRVNVSLVKGNGDEKQWASVSIALENNGKVKVKVKDNYAIIKVPFLSEDDALEY